MDLFGCTVCPTRQLKASQDKWFDLLGEDGLREQEAIVIKCEKLCADLGSSVSADVLSVEHGAREARTCVQARVSGPMPGPCPPCARVLVRRACFWLTVLRVTRIPCWRHVRSQGTCCP